MKKVCEGHKLYFIMAHPYSIPVYALNPQEALDIYRKSHPDDSREYSYTGVFRRWVIKDKKNGTKDKERKADSTAKRKAAAIPQP